jgi:hypothetical protein
LWHGVRGRERAVLLVGALLGLIFPISGPVSTVMMVVIAMMGAGII